MEPPETAGMTDELIYGLPAVGVAAVPKLI